MRFVWLRIGGLNLWRKRVSRWLSKFSTVSQYRTATVCFVVKIDREGMLADELQVLKSAVCLRMLLSFGMLPLVRAIAH